MPQRCTHETHGEYRLPSRGGRYEYETADLVRRRRAYVKESWRAGRRQRRLRLEAEFVELAERWLAETSYVSSVPQIVMHPAYQQIIGMGRDALGPILKWMRQGRPGYWFWALETIARETPITAGMRGRIGEMRLTWIRWGEDHGLV